MAGKDGANGTNDEMPRGVKAYRLAVDGIYIFVAAMTIYGITLAAGAPVLAGWKVADNTNRIIAGTAAVVTVLVFLIAPYFRMKGGVDAWKSEQKVISAGGAAGVFIVFTMAANDKVDTALGAAAAVFLLLFLAGGLMLEVPIGWARQQEQQEKDEVAEQKKEADKEMLAALRHISENIENSQEKITAPVRRRWFERRR